MLNHRQSRVLQVICLTLVVALAATACSQHAGASLDPASVADIVGDSRSALLVTDAGELWATGLNDSGQLGIGLESKKLVKVNQVTPIVSGTPTHSIHNPAPGYLPAPIRIATNVKQAAISSQAGAYLTSDGKLWVMGYETNLKYFPEVRKALDNQSLGGTRSNVTRPLKVMEGVKKIVGGWNLLILQENGDLFGTGDNNWGELGHGQTISDPLLIDQGVTDVFIGNGMTFYLKNGGDLYSCGRNIWGELGFGEPLKVEVYYADMPPQVRMNIPPQRIATDVRSVYSEGYSTLVLKTDGKLYMLGEDLENIYLDGSDYHTTPQLIAEDVRKMGIASLEAGQAIIVLNNSGQLMGWGSGLASLGVEGNGNQWAEITSDVKDFWTTPNLFVLTNAGRMRAVGPVLDLFSAEVIKDKDVGQLGGWSWD